MAPALLWGEWRFKGRGALLPCQRFSLIKPTEEWFRRDREICSFRLGRKSGGRQTGSRGCGGGQAPERLPRLPPSCGRPRAASCRLLCVRRKVPGVAQTSLGGQHCHSSHPLVSVSRHRLLLRKKGSSAEGCTLVCLLIFFCLLLDPQPTVFFLFPVCRTW